MKKPLKFKFEANQKHQHDAVASIVDLFTGYTSALAVNELGDEIVPNAEPGYEFDEDWLSGNMTGVMERNGHSINNTVFDDGQMLDGVCEDSHRYPIFTVEMETGTGKTYVYLRTMYELKARYGFRKYIIVVPSIAIYEGVIKSFQITREHFKSLYGNEVVSFMEYDGAHIGKVRDFAVNPYLSILVMTIDSFNGIKNNIYKATEKLPGEKKPFEYLQESRPILILDESQNYESDKSRMALRTLKPLFAVNYSATPGELAVNTVYQLGPLEAFKQNLVKKIQVEGVTEQYNLNDQERSIIVEDVRRRESSITAVVKVYVNNAGVIAEKEITLKKNDDLFQKTKNESFRGFIVDDIRIRDKSILFSNGSSLSADDKHSITLSREEIFRVQIEQTIRYHFERQKQLRPKGVKVLSLFFIDRVDNYVSDDGVIKRLFDEAYERLKKNDAYYAKFKAEQMREGYFARKKTKKGEEAFADTALDDDDKTKEDKAAEKAAYELIMKDKERLLGFDEPVAFIFAHSALREGWDNPNVFQICTLNTTYSEMKKRQEIGRGLRICVNQDGDRLTDDDQANILTVVANESYDEYCRKLQDEYKDANQMRPPVPSNAVRKKAKRNNTVYRSKEFRAFWNELCKKTEYDIKIDTIELIGACVTALNQAKYPEAHIVISRGKFVVTSYTMELKEIVKGERVKVVLRATATDGREDKRIVELRKHESLGRKLNEPALKDWMFVDILYDDGMTRVKFGNGKDLVFNETQSFDVHGGQEREEATRHEAQTTYPVFNIIHRVGKEIGLTRTTVLEIFKSMQDEKKAMLFKNPEGFCSVFLSTIRETLANHIAGRIEYTLTADLEQYDMDEEFPEMKGYAQKELIDGSSHSMYDLIQTDSEVEERFVKNHIADADSRGNVLCYFKFPATFKIRIPKIIGNYNPDWGVLYRNDDGTHMVRLVRETKGTMNPNMLQYPNEKRKIDCASKHFSAIGIDYRQVTDKTDSWFETK